MAKSQRTERQDKLVKSAEKLIKTCNMGKKYQRGTFSHFLKDTEPNAFSKCYNYSSDFAMQSDTGRGLFLYSPIPGVGKTHLGYAITDYLVSKGVNVIWMTLNQYFLKLQQGWAGDIKAERLAHHAATVPLLVIDDLHPQMLVNQWRKEIFHILIDARYRSEKSTVITSNISLDEIAETYGVHIADRIREMCDNVIFQSRQSFRGKVIEPAKGGE